MRFADVPYRETWEAMEELHAAGKAKHIGVSNLNVQSLVDLLRYAKVRALPARAPCRRARRPQPPIARRARRALLRTPRLQVRPACNQIENHLYLQQGKLATFCHDHAMAVVGFSPLGAASYVGMGLASADEDALKDPTVVRIAAAKGKTTAQVLLRLQLQRGIAVVPKSQSAARLRENLDLGGFELDGGEVKQLLALDRNRRFNDPAVYAKGWGEPGSWLAQHGYPLYE